MSLKMRSGEWAMRGCAFPADENLSALFVSHYRSTERAAIAVQMVAGRLSQNSHDQISPGQCSNIRLGFVGANPLHQAAVVAFLIPFSRRDGAFLRRAFRRK